MNAPIWLTPAGDLGIIPQQEFYEFVLDAYTPGGGALTYTVISGSLPTGLELRSDGSVMGIPTAEVQGVAAAVAKITTSTFTVRAKNTANKVADRTFSITVAGILPQIITPTSTNLGTFIDGTYVEIDINTVESNNLLESVFSIISGALPPGLSLNPITGVISGFLTPTPSEQSAAITGYDLSPYDVYTFDFSGVDTSRNYQFTIEADNGVTIDTMIYTIYVYALDTLTADNAILTADDSGLITADSAPPYHLPVILNTDTSLGNVRQNTRADLQIQGKDFDGDEISYAVVSGTLPPGLSLSTTYGWITGVVPSGQLGSSTYTFAVSAYKTALPEYASAPKTFTITILGEINDVVDWITDADLGIIYSGEVSELAIEAVSPSGKVLLYTLYESAGRLPPGLTLTTDGLISGRPGFETFILDSGTTTIDNNTTTFDQVYTFTVAAYSSGNYVFDTKTFTLKVLKQTVDPYENLYIQSLPSREQRAIYNNVLNNTDIFPENYLYRANDPWFGKNSLRRSLFLAGLAPESASAYITAMTLNHYWKTMNWGAVKTARALDDNFNVKYEVVYLEIIDRQVDSSGVGPNLAVTLPTNSRNISTIYPNSFPNMAQRIEDGIGYENRGILPDWMTSRQADGTVLGFTRAMILAYTKPGRSAEIAFRVQQAQDAFKLVDFTIDRYEWDSGLSEPYNKTANVYKTNNFVIGSGQINASVTSNTIIGVTQIITGQGNISGTFGTNEITGANTSFNTELVIGRPIYRADTNVSLGIITTISNATSLTVDTLGSSTFSNVLYTAEVSSTEFTSEVKVNDTIIVFPNVRLGTVKAINSDSNLTLYANATATVSNVGFTHNRTEPYSTPSSGDKYLKFPQVGVIS